MNLIEKWKRIKAKNLQENQYQYVETVDELNAVNPNEVQYLLGLFNAGHVEYNSSLPTSNRKDPTLREMSDMAIRILSKYENGFVLLVEGGRIDLASHGNDRNLDRMRSFLQFIGNKLLLIQISLQIANNAYQALHEAVHFDETIESATKLINEDETLVLVTADHS